MVTTSPGGRAAVSTRPSQPTSPLHWGFDGSCTCERPDVERRYVVLDRRSGCWLVAVRLSGGTESTRLLPNVQANCAPLTLEMAWREPLILLFDKILQPEPRSKFNFYFTTWCAGEQFKRVDANPKCDGSAVRQPGSGRRQVCRRVPRGAHTPCPVPRLRLLAHDLRDGKPFVTGMKRGARNR